MSTKHSLVTSLQAFEVDFTQDLSDFFEEQYSVAGKPEGWSAVRRALKAPPKISTIRANLILSDVKILKEQIRCGLETWRMKQDQSLDRTLSFTIDVDPILSDVLTIHIKSNVHSLDSLSKPIEGCNADALYSAWPGRNEQGWPMTHRVVVCDALCGEAVLRGSDIFVGGIMAADSGIRQGELVAVYTYVGNVKLRRGQAVVVDERPKQPRHQLPSAKSARQEYIFLGLGRSQCRTSDFFRLAKGLAIEMTLERAGPVLPPLSGIGGYPQNLPSTLVAHCLDLQTGQTILDMCAAPGGKTSHMASLLGNKATILACDKSRQKVLKMRDFLVSEGATCVIPLAIDTTQCCEETLHIHLKELLLEAEIADDGLLVVKHLPTESVDSILLDAPCTALGQRPKLKVKQTTVGSLVSAANYQKRFIRSAISLLRPGGTMVYSTCTFSALENELVVAHVLQEYPCMTLVPIDYAIGNAGLKGQGLNDYQCSCVRRFDPGDTGYDTIGFFVAKFHKH